MHDKPQPPNDLTTPSTVSLADLIDTLAGADPAAGPDLADEIAGRLEAELGAIAARPDAREAPSDAV